jgi:Tol biopolymer transport system component
LGVVFFELLTGEQAIKQQIDTITPADPVRRELPPIRRIQPHIPEGLVRLLDSMVATDPSRRPSSADLELRIDRLIAPKPRTGLSTSAAVIAVTLALVLLALIWSRFRSAKQESVQAGATRALTRLAGYELDAALAPGGQQFAFVWNGEDNHFNIYSKTLDSSKLTRLTETPAVDINPAWSPDGRSIAFVRLTLTSRDLMVVPAGGGKPRCGFKLQARFPQPIPDALQMTPYSDGPAWTKDGEHLAITHHAAAQESDSIYLVDLNGSHCRKLTFPEPQTGDYFPCFSPNGKRIAFVRKADHAGRGGLYILQTSGGNVRKIASPAGTITGLTWMSESTLVFSSDDRNIATLWTVSSDGGETRRFSSTGNAWGPVASNDGRRIVYTIGFRDVGIRYLPLSKSSRHPATTRTLLASSGLDSSAQFSPDGAHIVFVSDRSGALEIWKANADGSDPVQLTDSHGAPVGSPHWSPDSQQIVYDSVKAGYSAIYVMRADGSDSHMVAAGHEDYMMPTWSHDGRSIYFTVQERSEPQTKIRRQWLDSGRVVDVVQGRGDVLESADGQTIFFNRTGGQQDGIWKMPASGPPEAALRIVKGVNACRYASLGKRRLYYMSGLNPPWLIESYDLASGAIATVGKIDNTPEFGTPSLCISPNEKGIIFSQLEQSGSDVMMWEAGR